MTKTEVHNIMKYSCLIRRHILEMTLIAKSGHPGGSLSMTDIISTLYFYWLKIDPKKPLWEERDYFVLAKGHASPALYSAMAERGFFPVSYLKTLRQLGTGLQGHPDKRRLPGIEMSTGSLGQGLSIMVGISMGLKLDKKPNRVFGVLGDGECQEGQVWEAAMSAAHYNCSNLTIFIDKNNLQIDGTTDEIMSIDPIGKKFESFGWNVLTIDGHNILEIVSALEKAENETKKPTVIVANTVKGKGVSFMEHQLCFHGSPCTDEEFCIAEKELKNALGEITCQI
ncbi:MAG: transketolase [Candidatus Margulisbacteria bacterium GWF2_35_9]|nr:MAG: transketolase [Candidatus Margulisbacteria bacterium GWF2_35_9]